MYRRYQPSQPAPGSPQNQDAPHEGQNGQRPQQGARQNYPPEQNRSPAGQPGHPQNGGGRQNRPQNHTSQRNNPQNSGRWQSDPQGNARRGNTYPSFDQRQMPEKNQNRPRGGGQTVQRQHIPGGQQNLFSLFSSAGQQNQPAGGKRNFLFDLLPPALYNTETKKILGLFSAEDLLLAALILMFLDNDQDDHQFLVYALLYILLSDYIDLPGI